MRTSFTFFNSRKLELLGLWILLTVYFQQPLFAQHYVSLISRIRQADAIVNAIVKSVPSPCKSIKRTASKVDPQTGLATSITIAMYPQSHCLAKPIEVLKGDPSVLDKEIAFNVFPEVGITPEDQLILLTKDSDGAWQYAGLISREQAPEVLCLIPILEEKQEPAQIQKLINLRQKPSLMCPKAGWTLAGNETDSLFYPIILNGNQVSPVGLHEDIMTALTEVKDPASFDVIARALNSFPLGSQSFLLEWMSRTGDPRAIPILMRYLDQDDSIGGVAARGLRLNFPGAPGVTEAFEKRLKAANKSVRFEAIQYLIQRKSTPELEKAYDELQQKQTFYSKAKKVFEKGMAADAKRYCIQAMEDDSIDDYVRIRLADCFGTALNPEEQNQHMPEYARFLEKMAGKSNHFIARDAVQIAASVKSPAMIPALVSYLNREQEFMGKDDEYKFKAVMALQAMGEEARMIGARMLLQRLAKVLDPKRPLIQDLLWPALAIVWLGSSEDIGKVQQQMTHKNAPDEYKRLAAKLRPISEIADEGAFWIDLIEKNPKWAIDQLNWFAMRLGYLRDVRAMPVMLKLMKENYSWYFDKKIIATALAQLGEPAVLQMKSIIKEAADLNDDRDLIDVVCDCQKEASLPFVRELAKTRLANIPANVWACFSKYGSADDIGLLKSFDNYWTFGQNSPLRTALIEMREKFGYDLNGPIKKKPN